MDPNSALQLLDSGGTTTNAAEALASPPQTFAPSLSLSTNGLAQTPVPRGPEFPPMKPIIPPLNSDELYGAANRAPDAPLDTEGGASPWERFMLSFRREKQNQIKFLENKYGPDTVRLSTDGELIVRIPDPETGKSKDVLVDEKKMSAKDLIDLAGAVPEIAGAIVSLRGGKGIPWIGKKEGVLGVARDTLTSAAGAETAGAAKDLGFNLYDRGELDLGNVASDRAKMAGLDVAIGAASYPIARFFQFMKNPAHGYRGQVQFDALAAQKFFKDKYGVDVPLSIGESTGMPLASRSEVFIEKMPGGSEPIRDLKRKQEGAFRKLQQILMGTATPTDEAVGEAAINAIRGKTAPVIAGAEAANKALATEAQSGIEGIVSGATLPERQLYKTKLGEDLRSAVTAKRDAAKAEADRLYGLVRSLPGGEGKVFEGAGLQTRFQKILSDLPAPEKMVKTPTGLVDRFGREITINRAEVAPLREFVPPNVLQRLQSVVGLSDAKFSLSDLQQMRREVYDDIAKGEGVPGLGTHYLADIGKALTEAIDTGVSSLPTGDLKAALQAANKHYKEQVIPFNRRGLTELFRAADEPGHLSDSEIVSQLLGGQKVTRNWALMKETLGPGSNEFTRMRRAVADNLLEQSRLPGDETINAQSLIERLAKFRTEHREIADEVFGPKINDMFKQARMLGISQTPNTLRDALSPSPPAKAAGTFNVNADELRSLLADPSPTAAKLKALIQAESKRDELYKNGLIKAIGSGNLTEQTLRPTDFVNRVLESAEPKEVEAVLKLIGGDPALVEQLRQKTYEKVFRDAARNATAEDVNRIMSGENAHILSGIRIANALKNPTYATKIKAILGPEGWKDLEQYAKLQSAPEKKELSFAGAGGIAAGAQIANLERRGMFTYLADSARNFIFSTVLSKPPLRNWLTSIPEEPGKWSLILSSPPFLEAVTKEFGHGTGAEAFMESVKRAIDRSMQPTGTSKQPPRDGPGVVNPMTEEKRKYWESQLNQIQPMNAPARR